mmetsp:Transcript_18093/g.30419  ORF Transcript_18093/g.30419 Transcript_18093/m.30419 type:complete len:220 (+) Transcript_18093:440-1099(+)
MGAWRRRELEHLRMLRDVLHLHAVGAGRMPRGRRQHHAVVVQDQRGRQAHRLVRHGVRLVDQQRADGQIGVHRPHEGRGPPDRQCDRLIGQQRAESLLRLHTHLSGQVDKAELLCEEGEVGDVEGGDHGFGQRAAVEVEGGGGEGEGGGAQFCAEDEVHGEHLVWHIDPHGHLHDPRLLVGVLPESLEQPLRGVKRRVEVTRLSPLAVEQVRGEDEAAF